MAGWTARTFRKANAFLAPRRNPFERNLDYDFEVFAARRACVSSTKKAVEESLAAKAEIKSQTTEDLIEVDSAKQIFRGEAGDAGESRGIILPALFRI